MHIERTQVSDLSPIAGLRQLQRLYCDNTPVSDLTPIAGLQQLQRLNCHTTQVSDLTPIAGLQQLQELYCGGTKVSDLTPIARLQQLQYLDCSVTKVSDLTPIAGLRQLQRLYCSATQISDLTPIAGLLQLQRLNCSHTKVSDLTPIAGLQQLQHLDCNATQVSDLTPIAGLIDLEDVDAENCSIGFVPNTIKNLKKLVFLDLSNNKIKRLPRELGELGDLERLRLEGNPLEDPLPALIAPGQPQATINILRWLRGEPIEPEATEPDPAAPEETADDPPAIPEQGAGPRVVLDQTGRLVFAKPSDLDAKGNDRNRLEALHPALRKAATELAHALQNHPSNLRNERLLQKAEAYRALVDLPLDEVNFARLYGAGMQLLNAAGATRRALEAGWVEVPDLTPVQDECLANIENLHPPFVLASRDGQEMLADQSLIQLTSEDVQAIKAAGTALGNSLLEHGDLAEPAVGQTITDAAAEIGEGINDKRDAATAVSALRNGLITLTATSVVVCLPILGTWVIGGVVGTAAGGLAALTLNEAVKKTKAFQVTTGLMAQGLESFTERQFAEFTGRLKRHREQLLKQEPQLRRIAHIWGFKWVGPSLDWLKRNSPPDKKE
ncbi:MAG: leucine-rich repeat domain-containing protein [Roseomonas sp.]|nr:leucine-rich repeat domain-containing protein [Roseomonas sp.]